VNTVILQSFTLFATDKKHRRIKIMRVASSFIHFHHLSRVHINDFDGVAAVID